MADLDLAKAYDNHLAAARNLPANEVLPFRLDVDLAVVNVKTGSRVIDTHSADIPIYLPKENLANLLSLNELAAALKYAALRAEQEAPVPSEVKAKLARSRELRSQAMPVAKGLAANGALPQAELDPILAGRGPFDTAEDCVSLAMLLQKHEATIAGKHPLTAAQITEMAEVGSWLLTHLRPGDAPSPLPSAPSTMVDDRNRLATLLIRRHARLQVIAHYFYENDWEDRAPPLGSRSVERSAKSPTPNTAP
jgi:hypothetical protein